MKQRFVTTSSKALIIITLLLQDEDEAIVFLRRISLIRTPKKDTDEFCLRCYQLCFKSSDFPQVSTVIRKLIGRDNVWYMHDLVVSFRVFKSLNHSLLLRNKQQPPKVRTAQCRFHL